MPLDALRMKPEIRLKNTSWYIQTNKWYDLGIQLGIEDIMLEVNPETVLWYTYIIAECRTNMFIHGKYNL